MHVCAPRDAAQLRAASKVQSSSPLPRGLTSLYGPGSGSSATFIQGGTCPRAIHAKCETYFSAARGALSDEAVLLIRPQHKEGSTKGRDEAEEHQRKARRGPEILRHPEEEGPEARRPEQGHPSFVPPDELPVAVRLRLRTADAQKAHDGGRRLEHGHRGQAGEEARQLGVVPLPPRCDQAGDQADGRRTEAKVAHRAMSLRCRLARARRDEDVG